MKQIYRDMKKVALLIVFSCIAILVNAQESEDKNNASFNLGSGLNFSFNEGNYQFNLYDDWGNRGGHLYRCDAGNRVARRGNPVACSYYHCLRWRICFHRGNGC